MNEQLRPSRVGVGIIIIIIIIIALQQSACCDCGESGTQKRLKVSWEWELL